MNDPVDGGIYVIEHQGVRYLALYSKTKWNNGYWYMFGDDEFFPKEVATIVRFVIQYPEDCVK